MSLNKIRLVTFDVTHTLLRFSLSPAQQYGKIAFKYGMNINIDSIANNFNKYFKELSKDFPNFGKTSDIPWEEWWRILVKKTFQPYESNELILESLANDLIESYKSKDCWMLNDDCEHILNLFGNYNVSLGVISNFDPRLKEILKNVKIHHFFDFILTSYEAGFMKPNKNIFNEALKKSNIPDIRPCEALHIGDNVDLDFLGARLAGWQAVIVNDKLSTLEILQQNKNIEPGNIFSNLSELRQHFDKNKEILKKYYTSFSLCTLLT